MGAELELAVKRGKEVLKKTSNLDTVATAMVSGELTLPEINGALKDFPKLPLEREYTTELDEQVRQVRGVFGRVNPESRRTLSDRELTMVREEHRVLDFVSKALNDRVEDLKEYVRTSIDVSAEEQGIAVPKSKVDTETGEVIVAATPRDAKGHYILAKEKNPFKVAINGTGEAYSQEFKKGKVSVDGEKLLDLYEAGEISREEYLAFTRETRVLDEGKAGEFIRKNSERGLEILKKITTQGPPSTQLYVRKA